MFDFADDGTVCPLSEPLLLLLPQCRGALEGLEESRGGNRDGKGLGNCGN